MTRVPATLSAFAAVLALTCAFSRPARAAEDDYEFGERLARAGYFDYARLVYERLAKDDKRPDDARARARYGLALLGTDEARVAARRPDVSYADAKAKYDEALKTIDEFVAKAKDQQADDARQSSGVIRLGIVDWIGELQKDEKGIAAKGTTKDVLVNDAKAYAGKAAEVFRHLKENGKSAEAQGYASYYLAVALFYKAYAEAPCSTGALAAFEEAHLGLEDYATANETMLLGMYALDFLGRTDWEVAKCAADGVTREKRYAAALGWFEACTSTPNESLAHTTIIARGFYHLGQMCREAGRQEKNDFLKSGAAALARMKDVARILKVQEGVLAMLEWAEIEDARGNGAEAFKLARLASDAAKDAGFEGEVAKANAALARYVQRAKASDIDPDALMKIAESLYQKGKYDEAIPAYQQAIAVASRSDDLRQKFALPAWDRIATSYHKQGLLFEAAAAWDMVVGAWRADPKRGEARENDPKTELAYRAAQGMKSSFDELATKTRDPVLQARLARVREDIPRLFPMVSSALDQAYAQALTLNQEAFKELEETEGKSAGARAKLDRARAAFRDTAVNVKSDRQDNAWSVLVEIEHRLGKWDGNPAYEAAVKVADEAFAYWESPPAKKRMLEEADRVGPSRATHKARITMTKARALFELGRLDEAFRLARGYATTWPAADALWKQLALGTEIQVLIAQKKLDEAEAALKVMLAEYPGYHDLGRIVIQIANHYQALAQPMQDRITAIDKELVGTREAPGLESRLNAVNREEIGALERMSSLQAELEKWRAQRDSMVDPQKKALREEAIREVARLEKEVEAQEKVLAEVRARKAQIEPKIPPLVEERARVQKELAGPLSIAAKRYVEWDEAVKAEDARSEKKTRSSENVRNFAYRYYYLAKLRPEELEYWTEARRLYDEYFALPDVKALPDSDAKKRKHLTYAGEAAFALAQRENDPEKARALYEQAVANLEKGLAKHAPNTPLVLGMLSGEYATLPFMDPAQNRQYHFPVKRVADGAAFKAYVAALDPAKTPEFLPQFPPSRAQEAEAYFRSLQQFKREVASMDAATAKRTADSLKGGGFDAMFFADHADASVESLLPLAQAYIKSGNKDVAPRAMAAAGIALMRGPSRPDDGTPEWWETQTVLLEYFVGSAERGGADGGRDAKQADKMLVTFKRLFPHIGGAQRHEQTMREWKALQARLQIAAPAVGVTTTPVDLAAVDRPPPAPAPTAPTAPTPPMPAPSTDGPAMEGN